MRHAEEKAISAVDEVPLVWSYSIDDGLPTLTVGGTLTMDTTGLLYAAAVRILRRHRAEVLIDLSTMTVSGADTTAVFTRIMTAALQWPDVLVVVCAPAAVMPSVAAYAVDPRLLFTSVSAARSAALADVPTFAEVLLPVADAARRARAVITDACRRWDEADLADSAALVASELVTNAAVHARTMMTMHVRLRPCHLRIAVFDGSTAPAVTRRVGPASNGGRGLHLVEAVTTAWGSTPLSSGKVVWSALER